MTNGPVALITGGSTGVGAATARLLRRSGHRVAITGRDPDRLRRFAEQLGDPGDLLTFAGDSAEYDSIRAAVDGTVAAFGRLDVVVANAGFATVGNLAEGDPDEWREMVLTNVLGPAVLVKASLPALKETRGRIVMVGSVVGFIASRGNLYGATKWAVTALAENTRMMVTGDGIGVTLIAPGRVDTPFWDVHGGAPAGDNLTADHIAASIAWAIDQPRGVDVNTVTIRPVGSPT